MLQLEVLIREFLAVDGLATGALIESEYVSLVHLLTPWENLRCHE